MEDYNLIQMIRLFKYKNEKYLNKCVEYVRALNKLSVKKISIIEDKANTLNEERKEVAIKLSEKLIEFENTKKLLRGLLLGIIMITSFLTGLIVNELDFFSKHPIHVSGFMIIGIYTVGLFVFITLYCFRVYRGRN